MKRLIVLLVCCSLLCIPVRASEERLVALTFDDGPSGKYTRRLLEGLEERGIKATFFLCGYRIKQFPELTERICREGHEIGLHGYSHKFMQNMSETAVMQEFQKTMDLLPADCKVSFLRPPGGLCGKNVLTVAEKMDLGVVLWSVDPKDWEEHSIRKIVKDVVSIAQDGDVILLHDMYDSSIEAAFAIIDTLRTQGFRFVTVSELAQARDVAVLPGKRYARFCEPDPQEKK